MTAGIRTVIVPVKDLARAKAMYGQLLGVAPAMDAEAQQPITDVGGGRLIATVKDTDGNVVGLVQSP